MPPSARRILNEVAEAHGVSPEVLVGPRARKLIAWARFELIHRLRSEITINRAPVSLHQVGLWVNRDHSTIVYSLARFAELGLSVISRPAISEAA